MPLQAGGGNGQSRTSMWILRKVRLGDVSVTVWPKIPKDLFARDD